MPFQPKGEKTRTKIDESDSVFYNITGAPGIYSSHISGRKRRYFVVHPNTVESDLTARDPEELTSMLAGGEQTVSTKSITPHMTTAYHSEVERSQSVWWYLMLGVFLLAVGESFLSYRI